VRSKTNRPIVAVELMVCLREPDAQANRRVVVSHRFSPHLGPGQEGSVPVSVGRAFTRAEATMILFGGGSTFQYQSASRSCP